MAVAALPTFRTKAFIDGAVPGRGIRRDVRDREPGHGPADRDDRVGRRGRHRRRGRGRRAARSTTGAGRGAPRPIARQVLLRFADLLEANLEELALLDSLEAGKPITDCREVDLPETVKTFRWYAEAIDKVFDAVAPTGPDALGLIVREPIGVVGAVVPWNFPLLMATWKVAPALAAGQQPDHQARPADVAVGAPDGRARRPRPGLPDGVLQRRARVWLRRPARRSGGTWTSTW